MQQELGSDSRLIQVLVVASSLVMQAGLEALIATSPVLEVIGKATDLAILDTLQPELPDVVLWHWPLLQSDRLPSLDASFRNPLLSDGPAVVLLVEDWQADAFAVALQAGVRGILPAEATATELIAALEATALGLTVLHPEVSEALLASLPSAVLSLSAEPNAALTTREVEVLTMLAEGLGNKAIARRLAISEHTVKFHIGSIFSKLNASSRTEAVIVGARQGLILL